MTCKHCGTMTPRLTVDQRYCPPCAIAVLRLIAEDERRRTPRFASAKSLDRWAHA